jgi:uridine kinase
MKKTTLIGISGGSGSGKTSFIRSLRNKFHESSLCIISQDDYYLPRELQVNDENGVKNFDLPESIDIDAFTGDIRKLQQGEAIERMEYNFNNEHAKPKILHFNPAPVIVVEGLFVFHIKDIFKTLDLSIIINAKPSDKIIRRILRDQKERNYPLEDVLYRYKHHVMPSFERYIEPYIDDVDLIINNNSSYEKGSLVVSAFIESVLKHG